jgi:hypothetical protein
MALARRGVALIALTAALLCAASMLLPDSTTNTGVHGSTAIARSGQSPLELRVCATTQGCVPGHNPGAPGPTNWFLALGAISIGVSLVVPTHRQRSRIRSIRTPVGYPTTLFRPPIAV